MAAEQNITLKICGSEYALTIDAGKEELYRLAARRVSDRVGEWKKSGFVDYSDMNFLAMTALELAIENISLSQNREIGDEDVRSLLRISDRIDEYMNRLSRDEQ